MFLSPVTVDNYLRFNAITKFVVLCNRPKKRGFIDHLNDSGDNVGMRIPELFISDIAKLLGRDPSNRIVSALAEKAVDGAGKKKNQRIPEFQEFIDKEIPPGELDGMDT